jgi:hypothetical protein
VAHFHMLLTESMRRTDSENAEAYNWLDVSHELLDSPHGIGILHCENVELA